VTVAAGQVVLVTAQITLGTSSAAGAGSLRLWICDQPNGGVITEPHPIDWIAPFAVQNSLNAYPLTDTLTSLPPGSYSVGLCGQITNLPNNWDRNDWAYTTAEVISGASVLSGPVGPPPTRGR